MVKDIGKTRSVTIIGGGPAGLYTAWKLCKNGYNVTVIERQNFVGGFSVSIPHEGYKIDLGPHFVTLPNESPITKDVHEIVGHENIIEIKDIHKLYSSFYLGKINKEYPTIYQALFHLGVKSFLQGSFSLFLSKIKSSHTFEKSEDYLISLFGKYLYRYWCTPYLVNTVGTVDVPLEYAQKRFKPIKLRKIFSKFKNKKPEQNLINNKSRPFTNCYFHGGIGKLVNSLVEDIEKMNGRIILGANVESINHTKEKTIKFSKDNQIHESKSDIIIYATPYEITKNWYPDVSKDKIKSKNSRLHSIMVFFGIDSPQVYDGWLLTVFDDKLPYFRIAQPTFLTKTVAPPKKSLLSIEIRLSEDETLWNDDEQTISKKIERSLNQVGILHAEKIETVKVLKFKNLYSMTVNSGTKPNDDKEINLNFLADNEYFLGTQKFDTGRLASDNLKDDQTKIIGGIFISLSNSNQLVEQIISENSNQVINAVNN